MAERREKLGTSADMPPLTERIHLIVVGVVDSVVLEGGNRLLVVVAVFAVWRANYPKVVEVGGLDNDCVRSMTVILTCVRVEYHLLAVHTHRLHCAQLLRKRLIAYGQRHGNIMPRLTVKPFLLYPVLLADRVESCDNLLTLLATQTQTDLLEVRLIVFRQLIEEHTLVLTDTLDFLRVVKTTEINLAAVIKHYTVLLETAALSKTIYAVDGCPKVGVYGFLYRCANLAHNEHVATLIECEDREELRHRERLAR